jgi:hypothetical protein
MGDSVKKWHELQDELNELQDELNELTINMETMNTRGTVSKKYSGTVVIDNKTWEIEIELKN